MDEYIKTCSFSFPLGLPVEKKCNRTFNHETTIRKEKNK
jgi:hypothetical protein